VVLPRARRTSEQIWVVIVAALAASYVVAFVAVAIAHLRYPYEIDNLEGNLLAMCERVLHGEPLYAQPSVDYTAFCYPPLYFYLGAAVMRVLGPGYLALRLISVVATLSTAAMIYAVLRRHAVRPSLSLVAAAVFLGAFGRTHYVGSAGRVDALALALALGSLALAFCAAATRRNAVVAGGLAGLAILTKQPMVVLAAVAVGHAAVRGRRGWAATYAAAAGLAFVLVLAVMGLVGDPWLSFYSLTVPASHPLRVRSLVILGPVFAITTLPIALAAVVRHRPSWRASLADPWSIATVAYLGMSMLARAKQGGSANVFLPLVALAAIQLGRYAERLRDLVPRAAMLGLAVQLAVLWWSPCAVWPTARDVARGDELVARIAAIPGDVYVPAFPAYAVMAGKPWHAHYVGLCDVARLDAQVGAELAREIAQRRFEAVLPVTDLDPTDRGFCDLPALAEHYHHTTTIEVAPHPPDLALVVGGPQLFALVHGGKLGPMFVPPRAPEQRADADPLRDATLAQRQAVSSAGH